MTIWKKAISVGTSAALLASLLITAIAPAALATTSTVVSAGSVPRGVTSTGTATFTLTEDTLDEWAQAGVPYTLLITVLDNAGNNTLTLSGGTLSAPGSLAISGFTVGGNTIALTVNDAESVAIEKIVISGVKIKASATSALGAMQAFVSGTLPGILPATVTATGTLTLNANSGDTSVQVNSTGVCTFQPTGGLNGNLTFTSPAEAVAVGAVVLFSGSTYNLTVAALGNNRLAGAAVTQTVGNCAPGTLASPGTVVDSAILQYAPGSSAQPVRPGRNNEDAGIVWLVERTLGSIADNATITYSISEPGVVFSAAPTAQVAVSDLKLLGAGGPTSGPLAGTLSADRKTATWTVESPSTTTQAFIQFVALLDVATTATIGNYVAGTVTAGTLPVVPATIDIAYINNVITAVSAPPVVYIGENDQQSALVSISEVQAGFFTDTADANELVVCLQGGSVFTRPPFAVVTAGDLKLRDPATLGAATTVRGVLSGTNCAEWRVFTSSSATASTIQIRGSDAAGAVLPVGDTNGARINVPKGTVPGPVLLDIQFGGAAAMSSFALVPVAIATYRSEISVTAASQPTIPAGTVRGLAGNIIVKETSPGQFDTGDYFTCALVDPRLNQSTQIFLATAVQNDLPKVTTSGSGFVATLADWGPTWFSVRIDQEPNPAAMGTVTISNILYNVVSDAAVGPVLLNCYSSKGSVTKQAGTGTAFDQTVSNARVGSQAKLSIGAVSALGLNPTSGYTTKTPKVQVLGKYVTWKFTGGTVLAGQRVNILVAQRINGAWGGPKYLVSRTADANGIVTFIWKSNGAAVLNIRAQWPGNANYVKSTSRALGVHWR